MKSPAGLASGVAEMQQQSLMSSSFLALLVVALFALIHRLAWHAPMRAVRFLCQQGVPVLPYRVPFIGNILEIVRLLRSTDSICLAPHNHSYLHRILPFYAKYSSSYGKSFVFWLGRSPTLYVANADYLKDIMSTHHKHYPKASIAPVLVERLFGQGISSVEGEEWENQRRILNPAFFLDKIKGMVGAMRISALEMATNWNSMLEKASKSGIDSPTVEVEVAAAFKTLTADILAHTCFGTSYKQGKTAFEDQCSILNLTWKDNMWHFLLPIYRYFPTPTNIQSWKLQRSMTKSLKEVVDSRIRLARKGWSSSYGEDLLGLILAANDSDAADFSQAEDKRAYSRRLSISQIVDECKTFFFAGHETTATLLTWTMMLLAQHQDWQREARSEVLNICGDKSQTITAEDLGKLRVVSMILNETLRLYPPVPQLITRMQSMQHGKGMYKMGQLLLPGMSLRVAALPVVLHRDPLLWGEDAELFNPQRFAEGTSKACNHPNGFIPFGLGPHICIGQNFALIEAKVILAIILQHFEFSLSPRYQHAPQMKITLSPQFGVPIILKKIVVS
ncbi:hypothetical protein GOP47_0027603 [Adiantum capillus-veneris]|nr:hypothetical protein GOP47_0027603 [Adiantum capillus-veneris]